MKANLPQNEPKILERWEQSRLYDRIREARKGSPAYVLHDGPPYANGPIHLGHALNKCLKDFVVKSKNMAGFDAPYIPGWDCHGLPIEIKVDQKLGGKKLQMKAVDVRLECRKYAQKYLDLQRQQFKRIGVLGRFEKPYSTMTPEYESVVLATFYKFFEQGFVYKGLRPVYWCMHDRTALAEAEVEYENDTTPAVWVKYALKDDPAGLDPALKGKKVFAVIWTTTPWTLPASKAVAFNPEDEYVAVHSKASDEVYIYAEKLAGDVQAKTELGKEGFAVVAAFPGKRFEYLNFAHPFLDRNILGVLADYVTMDTGTGVVHTAPSHGAEDFATGVRYKLDPTCDVDAAGRIHNGLPEYEGLQVFKANQPIIDLLKSRGALLHEEKLEHSYPHCWRCHNPVIFRATEQWFISMETPVGDGTFRSLALAEIKKIKWDPPWGEERISNMVETRPDWCISRQRVWGVPIAVFVCTACNKPLKDPAVNRKVVELFAKSGADAWYMPESETLAAGAKCGCGDASLNGGESFKKEADILDVWFESGCSYLVETANEPNYPWPSDLYLEGGDQYRGWFMSSLLCSIGAKGSSPYKSCATPGWTLDDQGRAMSKSRGNDVDPVDIANRLGGEIVRMWVASVDFREDVVGSENLMQRVAENYRKIRNTFRYILSNLYDFDPARDAVAHEEMRSLDQFMLRQTATLNGQVTDWYAAFAFHRIYHRITEFCVVDLSSFYFDILKDRLYTFGAKSHERRAAQTALWTVGEALTRLMAPIMSFTCDEIWQQVPVAAERPESVHLDQFWSREQIAGKLFSVAGWERLDDEWSALHEVRSVVLKSLEEARNNKLIGGNLEAQVNLSAPESQCALLEKYKAELRYLFIVSQVGLEHASGGELRVEVAKADGLKCERCWNYSTRVGEDPKYPTVCERCAPVLRQMEGGAATA